MSPHPSLKFIASCDSTEIHCCVQAIYLVNLPSALLTLSANVLLYLNLHYSAGRSSENVDEVCNMLEAYACQVSFGCSGFSDYARMILYTHDCMQVENIQSRVQMLREIIDQSESVILINLDSQRNVMLRLSLQLEMGTFAAAISGLIGMAFGMNLTSSLEEVSLK